MIHTAKPVVVAIADKQPGALMFAIKEARSSGSTLRVVHSAGVPAQAMEYYMGFDATLVDELRTAGQDLLDEARHFVEHQDPSLEVEYVLTELSALEALSREADEAHILIVGADDVSWLDRLLRSNIAGYLAKHARCPVVIVPERELLTSPDGLVVVTVDGNTSAAGPLRMAFDEASARVCPLQVLHAIPPGTLATDAIASRASVAEVLAGWRDEYPDVLVVENYVVDDAADAVEKATERAELVIVGRPRNHNLPLSVSRPLAMKVLSRSNCPVAVVPVGYQG